jgi:tetratricopeptide (TPR) repeat protein
MAKVNQTGKKQRPWGGGKRNRKQVLAAYKALPVYFLLAVLVVTTVVPAIATSPTSPPAVQQGAGIAQQLTASQLWQRGRSRYQAGQFREAASLLEQAGQGYSDGKDNLKLAQTLNHLSLAYQKLGQWQQAQQAIERSINLWQSIQEIDAKGTAVLAQALNARGRMQLAVGNTEAALET